MTVYKDNFNRSSIMDQTSYFGFPDMLGRLAEMNKEQVHEVLGDLNMRRTKSNKNHDYKLSHVSSASKPGLYTDPSTSPNYNS